MQFLFAAILLAQATPVATAPKPISPWGWIGFDDYPKDAMRTHVQGRTDYRLDVGPDGRVTACTVTGTSGSQLLDQTSCALLTRRARFVPARDADGKPVAGYFESRVHWVTADEETVDLASATYTIRFAFAANGDLRECTVQTIGVPPSMHSPFCDYDLLTRFAHDPGNRRRSYFLRVSLEVDGSPIAPPPAVPVQPPALVVGAHFVVHGDSTVGACVADADVPPKLKICAMIPRFYMPRNGQAPSYPAKITFTFFEIASEASSGTTSVRP